ncbi:hypothetical protein [Helicobacter pylori]|uniref:hypothetical protein n=1 Tax=Helicobacter pylori TaxID=210 RepID=UPI000C309010|nr:hypothetical protein [Helicobacter pylori]WRE55184.1 hypothetical protein KVC90_03300 [Helicobacter pylori]
MRQKNETATSFNKLKEITLAIQAKKTSAQTSYNAEASEFASQSTPKPKAKVRAKAKNHALKPTKRAFSERQMATIRDNSQETKQANQQGDNANAFKGDEANQRGQQ